MSAIKRHIEDYAYENGMTFQEAMKDPNCLKFQSLVKPAVTIRFSHSGDPSVGFDGDSATLTFDVSMYAKDDGRDYIAHMTEKVAAALQEVWEFPVYHRQV